MVPTAALLLSLAVALPLSGVVALAAAGPAPSALGAAQWAYGGQRWVNATGSSQNGQWTAEAYLGWHVILTQTNVSNALFQVSAQRTMGAALHVAYCQPTCRHPNVYANFSEKAWEVDHASANFTTNGSVSVGGTSASALAILNSSSSADANITQTFNVIERGVMATHAASGTLWVGANASSEISFQPALGLIPLNLTSGMTWSATSNFSASGTWNVDALAIRTLPNGTTVHGGVSLSGSPGRTGVVTILGTAAMPIQLDGNVAASPVALAVEGPFQVREGLIFVPAGADLFGGEGSSATAGLSGRPIAATSDVDLLSGPRPHFGLMAATTQFASTVAPPSASQATPLAPMSAPEDGTNATAIQGQPESVALAQQGSACVLGSCTDAVAYPPNSTPPGSALPTGGWLFLGVAVIAAVTLIALVASRRRSVPPPPSPGASLYPPGAQASPPPSVTPPAPGQNPPPSPDPLDHLW